MAEAPKVALPMRRLGREYELDVGLVYLASDVSIFFTGQVIYVDGGNL